MAWLPPCAPRSKRSRVTSSINNGTPPVRAATFSTTSLASACRADSSATMSCTCWASSGASEIVLWCERIPQGGRNSGRVVARMNKGASAPRSAMPRSTSPVVGSAQCKSSNASTTCCTRAPAITQLVSAASCRRRNSSGAKAAARSFGSGISRRGASNDTLSAGSSFTCASELSRSARRRSAGTSAPPKRCRPHSAIGCSGVFWRSCEQLHSTQVCGVSESRE
jgi:hypothetical protein